MTGSIEFGRGPLDGADDLLAGQKAQAPLPYAGDWFALPDRVLLKAEPVLQPLPDSLDGFIKSPSDVRIDGSLGEDDLDTYAVNLVAGETYIFSAYGSGDEALADTVLYLSNGADELLALDDDGGAGAFSLLTYTATYSGLHYVGVGPYPGAGLSGDYTLDLLQVPDQDVVPDTFAGAATYVIGEVAYGYIDPANEVGPYGANYGEVDTYAFEVEAGNIYTIEIAGGADYASSYLALPPGEIDPVAVVYGPDGSSITFNDDISFPDDISARVSFVAEESGTYFLDVFSWAPWTGGYSITSEAVDLDDLDPLDALIWDSAANVPFGEDNTAYVYFGEAGETFGQTGDDGVSPMVTFGWNEFEQAQVMLALEEYERILGTNYEVTDDVDQATFRINTTSSTQYGAYFFPQDPAFGADQGVGIFNVDSGAWDYGEQQSLLRGGYAFAVVLHEFGHAHGLAHPHDEGGGSDVLAGVATYEDLGVYDLNRGVYTVMSYNDAWQTHPDGPTPYVPGNYDSGWSATLSAFDIAALQRRYGIINEYATGDDTYVLRDVNDVGTFYETIWDTGGVDTIAYDGAEDARIDLLAATLDYSPTGGGVVSFVDGVWGGYTIANGVVIENATGGRGDDILLGNDVANVIEAGDGDDVSMGRGGDDRILGQAGDDELHGGTGNDTLLGNGNRDVLYGDDGNDDLYGNNQFDTLFGGDGFDDLGGGNGRDELYGEKGNDRLDGGNGNDLLDGGSGFDHLGGGNGNDTMTGGGGKDHFVFDDADGSDTVTDFAEGYDKVSLLDLGTAYALSVIDGDTVLTYGDTTVTFLDAVLTASDIGYDPDSGAGFYA